MRPSEYRQRELPALDEGLCYFEHAYRGLPPRRAVQAVGAAVAASSVGRVAIASQSAGVERARTRLAGRIGCGSQGVAFVGNTTSAVALVAHGVRWAPGDRVLVHEDEVPGCVLPWRALATRGVEVEVLPSRDGRLEVADLEAACRARAPRWICVAHVCLDTGQRRDVGAIAEVARASGARLCLDVAQSLGVLRLGPGGRADAVVGCARKWLCGVPEVGFLALSAAVAEDLTPITGGAGASTSGARRWEGGALPVIPILGLGASLEALEVLDPGEVERLVLERVEALEVAGAEAGWVVRSPQTPGERSGIVHFELPDAPPDLQERLESEGVVVRVVGRRLRASPHAWTTWDDVARLVATVEALRRQG